MKDLVVDTASYGLVCRRDGWATLTGDNSLVNLTVNGIRTFGKDDGSGYDNGVTLYSGATLVIDGTGGHGINNKGSFLAAADTELTVKNVSGNNSNAINNTGNTAKMSLGNTVIDGLHVNVTMYNDTTMNTSAGNGMVSSGTVTLNGALEIRNVYTVTPDNRTENSVGSGIVVKSGGLVTGTGSIIVIGSGTEANEAGERGIFNGIFVQKNTLSIQGDITVENVRSQGIYAADADALVEGGNISIKDAGGNGIFINNTTGAVNATGAITVDGASLNGINNNSGGDITADSISIANTIGGYNGISSGGGGKITVAKNIAIANIGGTSAGTGQGNGINVSSGVITAGGNVVITGVTASGNTDNTSNNGITGKGQLNAGGDITIGAVAAGHGVFMDTGSVNAGGNITVEGSGSGRQGIYLANGNASMTAADISVANSGGNGIWIRSATDSMTATGTIQVTSPAVGRGINNVGTITAANIQVSEVLGNYNGIENTGTMNITGDYVKVDNVAGTYGIRNNGGAIYAPAASIYVSNINVAGTAGIGLQMENASILQAAEIWVDTVSSQANTLTAERVVILNATKQNGLRIYNANSNPDITITELVVYNCGGYAAAAAKAITETNLHITTLWYQDCKNIVHGNIKSGIGEVKEGIPEFVAAALSSAANTEGGN